MTDNFLFLQSKEIGSNIKFLTYPSVKVVALLKQYENLFQNNINKVLRCPNIHKILFSKLKAVSSNIIFCSEVHNHFICAYLIMRLSYHIKFISRSWRGKRKTSGSSYSSYSVPKKQRKLSKLQHS